MKIGFCAASLSVDGDPMGLQALPFLKESGYDYAELTISNYTGLSEEDFREACRRVEDSGLPAETACWMFPGGLPLYGPMEPVLDWIKRACDRSARLGVEVLVFGSGRVRSRPEGMTHEQAFSHLTVLTSAMAPIARQHGVTIVMEPLNRAETDMIRTVSDGARLVRAVNHPSVRLLADYYHFAREQDAFAPGDLPLLAHAHCAEPEKRGCPTVIDKPFANFLTALRSGGYDVRLSLEPSATDRDAAAAFPKLMKDFFAEH